MLTRANGKEEVEEIKNLARGRWRECISALCCISLELLDGKKHPCPKCGGKDRFRMIDEIAGALFCNQCFNANNGDGLAAIMWLRGWDFPTVIKCLREYLGKPITKQSKKSNIVATYDYRDEAGGLLMQAVRMEPKDFRQRKPKPGGCWDWSVKGVRVVPYRLPEMLASDATELVFIPEGEKDCDNLAKLGLIATTNAGGAGKWRAEHAAFLQGRSVVILSDNDEVGRNHAQAVARSLSGIAASIQVLSLPDLPEKGDVSDWLAAGGTADQLRELVATLPQWNETAAIAATTDVANECVESFAAFQPFPLDCLPAIVAQYVEQTAEAIGCDASFIALPLLVCLGAAIGNTRRIRLKSTWQEPPILWGVIVGDSGSQKTPALSAATRAFEKYEAQALVEFQTEWEQYKRDRQNYEVELAAWKKPGKTGRGAPPVEPMEPVPLRYIVNDTTVEALADRLQHAPRGLALVRDELAGWLYSFDQYKGGKGGDVAHWLSMYNAKPLRIDRKTGNKQFNFVESAAVCITGGIQPETLKRSLGDEHWENGLAARLLLCYPWKRDRKWNEATVDVEVERAVTSIFEKLLALDFDMNQEGKAYPVELPLNAAAKQTWIEFFNSHGKEQGALEGREAALWSKLEGTAPRLALVVHLARVASDEVTESEHFIDHASMSMGITLAKWFGNEARRVYEMLGESEEQRAERKFLDFIKRRGGRVTVRNVTHFYRPYRGQAAKAEAMLASLVKKGYGVWEGSSSDKPGQPTAYFCLRNSVSVSSISANPEEKQNTGDGDNSDLAENESEVQLWTA